ncbi:hypothetical protein K438DRAFT_314393 [Mycena galopus ATCC 62051]|nr:hypothetical protein K438DRAFT_314393 [Mycena galopus ATCC 62051]
MTDFPGIEGIYGPLEIGATVCTLLYGMQTLQTLYYYRDFPGDAIHLKFMVALTWFLELGQTICNLHANYLWSITFYGRPPQEMLLHPSRFLLLGFLFSALSRTAIELFFANRIRVLAENSHITLLCLALTISCLAGSVILMVKIWTSPLGLRFLKSQLQWAMIVFTSVDPLADILIALYLCFHLWRLRKSGTQFRRTQRMLDTLVLWTIGKFGTRVFTPLIFICVLSETTVLTSSIALMQLVLFLTRTDLLFLAFRFVHSKLYANSMLAVLNGRVRLRSDDQKTTTRRISDLAFHLPVTTEDKLNDSVVAGSISGSRGFKGDGLEDG